MFCAILKWMEKTHFIVQWLGDSLCSNLTPLAWFSLWFPCECFNVVSLIFNVCLAEKKRKRKKYIDVIVILTFATVSVFIDTATMNAQCKEKHETQCHFVNKAIFQRGHVWHHSSGGQFLLLEKQPQRAADEELQTTGSLSGLCKLDDLQHNSKVRVSIYCVECPHSQ